MWLLKLLVLFGLYVSLLWIESTITIRRSLVYIYSSILTRTIICSHRIYSYLHLLEQSAGSDHREGRLRCFGLGVLQTVLSRFNQTTCRLATAISICYKESRNSLKPI